MGSHWPQASILPGRDLLVSGDTSNSILLGEKMLGLSGLVFFFLLGAMLPIIPWTITRKYPASWARYVNFPVLLSGAGAIPPASAINYVPWALVGFIFQVQWISVCHEPTF